MNTSNSPVRVLLFDLGGVLVEFDPMTPLGRLTQGRLDSETVRALWLKSEALGKYESGLTSPEGFAVEFMKDLGLDMTIPQFLKEFASWEAGPIPGGKQLLADLRGNYRLACLSNNNAIHWDIIGRRDGWQKEFEKTFLSFEMKCMKPERRIFEAVVREMNCEPGEILFFDDTAMHVEGAINAGLHAAQVAGVEGVRSVLRHMSLI